MRRAETARLPLPLPLAREGRGEPDATAAVRWPARLTLQARCDGGATRLHGAHEGPLRLLKTLYPEGPGIAHAVLVHPPGGLVGGDRLDVDLQVAAGAHLLVTTPAASRFYRSAAGEAAQVVQAHVAAGARLEWLPQETLAYDGCDALNTWQVRLEGDAALMAMEVLALGLGASGKPFASGRFVQQFQIEGLWRERGVIASDDEALLEGPCGLAGHRVLGTLVLAAGEAFAPAVAEAALDAARSELAEVHGAAGSLLAGATLLHGRLLVLRLLAHEVEPAMRLLRRVRGLWRQACWGLAANEPRIWAS
ncbi:MAG: urease accessory protein UreD [Burkholderiales bacterium]|nr:urease accessory protein UreD [Burkholderiales bacterium]